MVEFVNMLLNRIERLSADRDDLAHRLQVQRGVSLELMRRAKSPRNLTRKRAIAARG
jgi:hypothetical protein